MVKLTPRLMLVSSAVNKCGRFVDIGTDHAYLAAYLIENGVAELAVASDINPNPLKNARKTLDEENLSDRIKLRLSDGFKNIEPYEAQEIAVAGMGGIMIAEMLLNTPWLKDKEKHLILQPMTHSEDVRYALLDNGFLIENEKTVKDGERIYLVISARYSGEVKEYPLYFYYVGSLLDSGNETDRAYALRILKSLKKKYEGALKAGREDKQTLEVIRSIENAEGNRYL